MVERDHEWSWGGETDDGARYHVPDDRKPQRDVPLWMPIMGVMACGLGCPSCYFGLAVLEHFGLW